MRVGEGPTPPASHQLVAALMERPGPASRRRAQPSAVALPANLFTRGGAGGWRRGLETGAARMENVPEACGAARLVETAAGARGIRITNPVPLNKEDSHFQRKFATLTAVLKQPFQASF